MNKNKRERKFLKGFKSIQSTIFAAVSVLVLCAVLAATAVSVRYTNSTVMRTLPFIPRLLYIS